MAWTWKTPFGGKSSFIRDPIGTTLDWADKAVPSLEELSAKAVEEEKAKQETEEEKRRREIEEATEKIIAGRKPEEVAQRKRATFLRARMGLLASPLGRARQTKTEADILGQRERIREAGKTGIELAGKQAQFEWEQANQALRDLEEFQARQERGAFQSAVTQAITTGTLLLL